MLFHDSYTRHSARKTSCHLRTGEKRNLLLELREWAKNRCSVQLAIALGFWALGAKANINEAVHRERPTLRRRRKWPPQSAAAIWVSGGSRRGTHRHGTSGSHTWMGENWLVASVWASGAALCIDGCVVWLQWTPAWEQHGRPADLSSNTLCPSKP